MRAPWLTQGYLKNPEASEQLWEGGYLHTGDIGKIDRARLSVQITDRIKDVIKTGGEWVSSLEIEDILLQMPGVERGRGHRRDGCQMGRAPARHPCRPSR